MPSLTEGFTQAKDIGKISLKLFHLFLQQLLTAYCTVLGADNTKVGKTKFMYPPQAKAAAVKI